MHITVIMLGLLGDVLMRTPVLREIKKTWPNSKTTCVVDPIGAEVLAISPDVDDIIIISRDKTNRPRYFYEKLKTQFRLWSSHHDWLIDLYGGTSSRFHAKVTRSRKKIIIHSGTVTTKGVSACNNIIFLNPHHLSNIPLSALRYFPTDNRISTDTQPHIDPRFAELGSVEGRTVNSVICNEQYFFISMGSGDPKKIIDLTLVADLCKFTQNKWNMVPVVAHNPGQEFIQEKLCTYLKERLVEHVRLPLLSIPALAKLIHKSRFVIVPDTGLYHLAVGLDVPILGIFTHTNPELVRPSRGIFEICFKASLTKELSPEGLPYGTRDLGLIDLKDALSKLIRRLGNEK